MCTYPGQAAQVSPRGYLGAQLPSLRPLPRLGDGRSQTREAKKALKEAARPPTAVSFLPGSSSGNQSHKCRPSYPKAKPQIFHMTIQEAGQVLSLEWACQHQQWLVNICMCMAWWCHSQRSSLGPMARPWDMALGHGLQLWNQK